MFKKVMVASRGEIALRVFKTLREMEIPSVAIYADQDENSLSVKYADYSYPLHGSRSRDTYMNIDKIINLALEVGADAIHPAYGFLSEKHEFAKAVEDAGLTFIGPSSNTISMMGDKVAAKEIALKLNVPLVPGTKDAIDKIEDALVIANQIGFPVLIKPAAGGGGKGMQIVFNPDELEEAFHHSQRLAKSVFGDSSVFIEKYFTNANHIEVQILGDKHGNIVHLGERECSIQRRFQKVVEESPCLLMTAEQKQELFNYAIAISKEVKYVGAGTVEFIYSNGKVYFLEMNTRIQVEHAVTEMVTGIDIVKAQIMAAAGIPLPFKQDDITFRGHSIECRIYAEDPLHGFIPSHGMIKGYVAPSGIGVRVDSGAHIDNEISHHFDPMMSKLIVLGNNRKEAIMRMRRALQEYIIEGPKTNIDYLRAIMVNKAYIDGKVNTKFIDNEHDALFEATKTKPFWEKKLKELELFEQLEKENSIPSTLDIDG